MKDLTTCASCRRRIRPVGRQTECRPCRRLTNKCRNSLNCAAYYKRTHNQAFCSHADIAGIFAGAAIVPAVSTYHRRRGTLRGFGLTMRARSES